ncbi:amidohydrolase family protein [Nocardia sp. NBC_00565]|uniref:amidohydrolase family protein n=1 Tax=Nocardia sp. NBC_00565 TaxID=2975993 RepID=UPI002E817578|nr:amidohydrolase family protein [Nocardia sp. NBC_00565]WUC03859.1 amidohydrolase family protein [Nocardia sp. NBC_00565]
MLTDGVALTDHHCHGVVAADLDRPGFERLLSEGQRGTFDSTIGLAVRRWCAPVLDLAPHADPAEYLTRRAELGWREVSTRLLRAAGTTRWFLDTGFGGGTSEFAASAGGEVREIVRLEQVAEQVIAENGTTTLPFEEIEAALRERARNAVGLKTIVAYRCGLDFPLRDSPPAIVAQSRLTDPDILGWLVGLGVRIGVEFGLPLQFHTGFGDTDLRLHRADPLLLTDFLRTTAGSGLSVMLLHCWPFHRNAAYLAHAFEHVRLDLGLTIPYVGQRSTAVLAETLELAPFDSMLYSSDGYGLPELHYLGALLWRRGLGRLLDEWIGEDVITPADAERLVIAIAHGNAARAYPE